MTRADWIRLVWLGLVGHCLYQYLFVGGLAKTSVANGALLVSATPIVITLFSSIGGKERIGALHWAGTLLSLLGIYIVVGRDAHAERRVAERRPDADGSRGVLGGCTRSARGR